MAEITIPFKSMFRDALLTGVKVCTARKKRMGKPGDRFLAFDQPFEILSVEDVSLDDVARLWKDEGCTSRAHFIEVWNSIHPKVGYRETQRVYVHRFKKVLCMGMD